MNDLSTIKNEIQSSISDFNEPFTNYLVNLGLPVEGILAPIDERQIVINSIQLNQKYKKYQLKIDNLPHI